MLVRSVAWENLAADHPDQDGLLGNKLDVNFHHFHKLPLYGYRCRRMRRSTFGKENGFRGFRRRTQPRGDLTEFITYRRLVRN